MKTTRMLTPTAAQTAQNICPQCQKTVRPKRTPGGLYFITTFCNRRCSRRFRMHPRPVRVCAHCRADFTPPPSVETKHRIRKYCSKRCSELATQFPNGWIRRRRGYPVFWTGKAEILVHRLIMEEHLGRPLRETETVHHLNGDRSDWNIENLELWDHAQPHGQRVPDKLAWCVTYLLDHGYHVTPPAEAQSR